MNTVRATQHEAAEDLFFGQVAIIWARWFLILAGTILILWGSTNESDLVVGMLPILGLMVMNFFLHGRYLVERPANQAFLRLTSLIDLVLIGLIVVVWAPRGLSNPFFIFYYPVVLAVAFVFPRRDAIIYTIVALASYTALSYAAAATAGVPFLSEVAEQKLLIQRLLTIAAMGGLGTYYWRIQRNRRRAIGGEHEVVAPAWYTAPEPAQRPARTSS